MNTDGTGFNICKECHKSESLWNHTATDHKEGEQLEDQRNRESSCNFGGGTYHRVQSLMFMMMIVSCYYIVSVSGDPIGSFIFNFVLIFWNVRRSYCITEAVLWMLSYVLCTYLECHVVITVTRYRLDGPGFEFWWGRDFLHLSSLALWPMQPPMQWVLGLFTSCKAAGLWH